MEKNYKKETTAQIIQGLNYWVPHEEQALCAVKLFYEDIRSIFVQCGRKWGKTELATYILWRWAQNYPESGCYYIAPLLTQAKEIIWADPRLQGFGPREWLLDGDSGINNTEMRLRFKNGSFIKVDGSDNFEKHRGTRPSIVVYEEFKDHRKEFRRVMRPNLSVYNAPEIFIGTPPEDFGDEESNEFLLTAKEHQADPRKFFLKAPSWSNPNIPKAWFEEEKQRLYARGEGDVWEREYAAQYVKGGAHKIFPMLKKEITKPHSELMIEIHRDRRKLEWYCFADPAGATCFAVLLIAINPYTRHLYALGEIYETKQEEMTVSKIGQKARTLRQSLTVDPRIEWRLGYDEAETWFANEMLELYEESWEPTQKAKHDKISGLSLIKDILNLGKLTVSSECPNLFRELDSYRKDENGRIPKKNDHLIDCFRYILDASYYALPEKAEPVPKEKDEMWRGARIEDDFPGLTEEGFKDSEYTID